MKIIDGFPGKIEGRLVFVPQDNLNTDGIYGKDYTYREGMTREDMARVVMENYDPEFSGKTESGDVLVGSRNFGTGIESRTGGHGASGQGDRPRHRGEFFADVSAKRLQQRFRVRRVSRSRRAGPRSLQERDRQRRADDHPRGSLEDRFRAEHGGLPRRDVPFPGARFRPAIARRRRGRRESRAPAARSRLVIRHAGIPAVGSA